MKNDKEMAQSFLTKDSKKWTEIASYQELKKLALAMTVVNDSAEGEQLL